MTQSSHGVGGVGILMEHWELEDNELRLLICWRLVQGGYAIFILVGAVDYNLTNGTVFWLK